MVGEVVVGVRPDEGDQVGHRLERVEVVVLAEERLPLVVGVAPARGVQREHVAVVQASSIGTMSATGHSLAIATQPVSDVTASAATHTTTAAVVRP